jgi:LPXTG-motif cell wall-anchored protein
MQYGSAQMVGNTIGTNTYQAELYGIDSAVPYPDSSMSCETMQAQISQIDQMLVTWKQRLLDATHTLFPSRTKINNVMAIITNLGSKRKQYSDLLAACLAARELPPPAETPGGAVPQTGGKSSSWLLLLALGAAGILIIKKNKKRRQRASK